MLHGERHSQYKGLDVTVRWTELSRASPAVVARQFTGSYLVEVPGAERHLWQELPAHIFHTRDTASAYALKEARREIDTGMTRGR